MSKITSPSPKKNLVNEGLINCLAKSPPKSGYCSNSKRNSPKNSSKNKEEDSKKNDPVKEILKWANSKLARIGVQVSDLSEHFSDGVNLVLLLESILKHPFNSYVQCPKTVFERRKNINVTLTYLTNIMALQYTKVNRDDILWGHPIATYNVLRAINIHLDHGKLPPLPPGYKYIPPPKHEECFEGEEDLGLGEDPYSHQSGSTMIQEDEINEKREQVSDMLEDFEDNDQEAHLLKDNDQITHLLKDKDNDQEMHLLKDNDQITHLLKDEDNDQEAHLLKDEDNDQEAHLLKDEDNDQEAHLLKDEENDQETHLLKDEDNDQEAHLLKDEEKNKENNLMESKEIRKSNKIFPENQINQLEKIIDSSFSKTNEENYCKAIENPLKSLVSSSTPKQDTENINSQDRALDSNQQQDNDEFLNQDIHKLNNSNEKSKTENDEFITYNSQSINNSIDESQINKPNTSVPSDSSEQNVKNEISQEKKTQNFKDKNIDSNNTEENSHQKTNNNLYQDLPSNSQIISEQEKSANESAITNDMSSKKKSKIPIISTHSNSTDHSHNEKYAIGIDFGTSTIRYRIFKDGNLNDNGEQQEFSASIIVRGMEQLFGLSSTEIEKTDIIINDLKRFIGRSCKDISQDSHLGIPIFEDPKTGRPYFTINGIKKSPEELVAILFSEVKRRVMDEIGEEVKDCVITVPTFFSQVQRQATIASGSIAGLNVIRIINETAAVAMTHVHNNSEAASQKIVIFDVGAGKVDAALIKAEGKTCSTLQTAGDTNLGGIDFDRKIFDFCIKNLKKKTGKDYPTDLISIKSLMEQCEKAKITLSSSESASIDVGDIHETITRKDFEAMCSDIFDKISKIAQSLVPSGQNEQKLEQSSQQQTNDINDQNNKVSKVVLVGGCSNIPKIKTILTNIFGDNVEFIMSDVKQVANGAAIQGAIMKGDEEVVGLKLTNSTPLSLGISLANGSTRIIIPRGTQIPAVNVLTTTTVRDNQQNVGFDVVQGERRMAIDNLKLGHVMIDGIQKAKKGVPKIDVTMNINDNGILIVTAKDRTTQAYVSAKIENKNNLSVEEINKMIEQAEKNKVEDDQKKKTAQIRFQLLCFIDKAMNTINNPNHSKGISSQDQETFKCACSSTQQWALMHEDASLSAYQKRYSDLRKIVNQILPIE